MQTKEQCAGLLLDRGWQHQGGNLWTREFPDCNGHVTARVMNGDLGAYVLYFRPQ